MFMNTQSTELYAVVHTIITAQLNSPTIAFAARSVPKVLVLSLGHPNVSLSQPKQKSLVDWTTRRSPRLAGLASQLASQPASQLPS